nr:MAG TPA: hypothetical protein [Caudoviricetes sp.]
MANVINMGGGGANVQSKTVKSTTAKQTLTPPSGVDGFSPVIVSPMVLQEKVVTLSTSQQVLAPPSGVDGFSKVTVPAASNVKSEAGSVTGTSSTSLSFSISAAIADIESISLFCGDSMPEPATTIRAIIWQKAINWDLGYKGVAFYGASDSGSFIPAIVQISSGTVTISIPSTYSYLGLEFKPMTYQYAICGT